MRKRLQLALCVLLTITSIACLCGMFYLQSVRKKEVRKAKEQIADLTEPDEWQQEHDIDWDSYFETGGYFGDYGDETVTYPAKKVKGLRIQAEYATIHVLQSEDVSDVEVFTQIGGSEDAIRCENKEGIVTITQANLSEEDASDGSYIEVTLPAGKELEEFFLVQRDGSTSVSLASPVHNLELHMDEGSFLSESLTGKSFFADINTANIYVKQLDYDVESLRIEEGVFRSDEMDVEKTLSVFTKDGSVNASLKRPLAAYHVQSQPGNGSITVGDVTEFDALKGKKKEPYLSLRTVGGSITLDTGEEEEE
ncbi:MAG: DUF4097 domain-containing protein [Lachnospiraceae bacterium]|jgi:hypothetical protein|nr:DUF4097 domain-containing protein [Lachnospiraceae bacterium]